MEKMFYSYVYTVYIYCIYINTNLYKYIEEIQRTEFPKLRKVPKFTTEKMNCPYYFLIKKMHFEKLLKGTPLGGFPPQIMCICTPNQRTPSLSGNELTSIEILSLRFKTKIN